MPPARSILRQIAGPSLVFLVAVAMAVWTWNTWPDVLVDFGKELYIAWRLSAGDPLYSGVAYYMGPLSPTVNGLLFSMFGVGLRTLVIANLCVTAAVAALLMHLAKIVAGPAGSIISGLVFVLLFAFTQYTPTGNYNFICPYEHEYTHGMLISLATLAVLWRGMSTRHVAWFFVAGVGCGLVALTRAELFIAIGAAVLLAMLLVRQRWTAWLAAIAGGVTVVSIAVLLLARHLSTYDALIGVAGSWPSMFNKQLTSLPFYRQGMGLLHPAASLRALGVASLEWIVWLGIPVVAAVLIRPAGRPALVRSIVMTGFSVYALAAVVLWKSFASTDFFRPLSIAAIVWTLLAARSWLKQSDEKSSFRLTLVVFAALLLLKMALYARIHQYGFAVAMPATVTTAVTLGVALPKFLDSHSRCGALVRATMLATGGAVVSVYLVLSANVINTKTVQVGSGSDAFWADATRGPDVNQCLVDLAQLPSTSTVLVVPEGAMLNYLARRVEPTPYANFNPPDLAIFGEDRVAAALKNRPADYVVIPHKDTSEFGVRFFGHDYGQPILQWIRAEYRTVRVIGSVPMVTPKRFGIAEFERKSMKR